MKTKKKKTSRRIKRNNKLYTGLFIFITIISYYIFTYQVNAGANDSELVKNYIGHYVYAYYDNQSHGYNAIRYTMNNKTVYCIELGTDITSYTYNSTDDLKSSGLTDEQIEYLKLLSYYGYDYQDHQDDIYYYMATQELIWIYLNEQATFEWIESKSEPDKKINIEKYKQNILELVDNHLSRPDLPNNITIKVGNSVSLEDENNVISNYYVEENRMVDTKIDGNTLIITPKGDTIGETSLILKEKSEYDNNNILYYYDNSQKMISAGTIRSNEYTINLSIEGANLKVLKFDNDNNVNVSSGEASLEGAEYEIYNSNNDLIERFQTDKYGTYTVKNLALGKYYIKEIKPSKGYLLNDEITNLTLSLPSQKAIVYEEVIKSKIEILKMYGYDSINHQLPEPNITFNIYNKDNKLYKSLTTNENGYLEFYLPYGTYTIKQENTTPGYSKIEDIKLKIDENSNNIIRYNLLNKDLSTYLKIIKIDSDSGLPILNNHATFKIKNLSDGNYIEYENNNIFETNDQGEVIIPVKLSYGKYEIEEVKVPENYYKDKNVIITIDENSYFYYNDDYGCLLDIELSNDISKSKLTIIKDKEVFIPENGNYKYDFKRDENSILELYAKDDIYTPDGLKHYSKNDLVETIQTDDEGISIIRNLYYGSYCLREVKPDIKYIENEDTCFELQEQDYTVYIHSYLKKGSIRIMKTDAKSGLSLKGAIIELYTEDNILVNTSMTNEKGIIKIDNIPLGNYYLKEKKAPNNYNLDDTKYYLKLEEADKEIPMYLTNYKMADVKPSHTGIITKNKTSIILLIFIITTTILIKIFFNKIKKK